MKYANLFIAIVSFHSIFLFSHPISPTQNTLNLHRKILDPQVPIDEILPAGVIPLEDSSLASFSWPPSLTMIGQSIAGGLAIGYGATVVHLLYLAYSIQKKGTWSGWIDQFKITDERELARELFLAANKKYAQSSMQLTTLEHLLNEIEQELKISNRFINTRTWIEKLKLKVIFPNQDPVIAQAIANIKNLIYLKLIALKWAKGF